MNYKSFLIWLLLVILWNFGWPNAEPIFDIIMAILLSFLAIALCVCHVQILLLLDKVIKESRM